MRADSELHFIFFRTTNIQHLQKAKTWYCDGTFKAVAKPFKQLYTIHAFIRQDDCVKQVPLIFILMSRMKEKDYIEVFNYILSKVTANELCVVVVDFENAVWPALREVLPSVTVRGCCFH